MKSTKLALGSDIALAARVMTVFRNGVANGEVDTDSGPSDLRALKGFAASGGDELSNRELIKLREMLFEIYDVILKDYLEGFEDE